MKSPGGGGRGGGGKSGSSPSGPSLTPAQKAKRDRAEAHHEKHVEARARRDAVKDRRAGARERHQAHKDEAEARAYLAKGEKKYAKEQETYARHDLARARRDDAQAKRDDARAGRDKVRQKRDQARSRTAGLAHAGRPGEWILGGNDRYLTCAATAVANSLLLATGQRLSDEDVLGLHGSAGGTEATGTSVLDVLEAAQWPGWARRAEFETAYPAALGVPVGTRSAAGSLPLILELALPAGVHAVLLADDFAVTWGQAVPVTQAFLDHHVIAAWQVTWGGV